MEDQLRKKKTKQKTPTIQDVSLWPEKKKKEERREND